jgi:hypothetical protein
MSEPLTPHSIEAERAALGAVLMRGGDTIAEVAAILTPDDFFRLEHGRLFTAMQALHRRCDPIDLLSLSRELGRGGLADIGGPAYITGLTDGVPKGTNVAYYTKIIKQAAQARCVIAYARQAIETFSATPEALANGAGHRFAEAIAAVVTDAHGSTGGLPEADLEDAVDVAAEGREIAATGIQFLIEGLIPAYGMLGMLVAYAKVGKSTFGQAMGASIAMGRPFLDRAVLPARVLNIASEDPGEYTAFVARSLEVDRDRMTFYRCPIMLDTNGIDRIRQTVTAGGYGLVLLSSHGMGRHLPLWRAVARTVAAAVRQVTT